MTGKEPNCRDRSDEKGCKLITLKDEEGYNKNIPPIDSGPDGSVIPADVKISIVLMKYHNLKKQTSLNALTDKDIEAIWLPLILYDNTDQKEVTRLGEKWEWTTDVTVTREGNFTRSGVDELDEAEIFEGAENRLTMYQTYTREFQCNYELQHYPFDTQVTSTRPAVCPCNVPGV